ncbi:MAG: hypothetical protein ACLFVJ_10215, partial [Persicimonas sp.]
MLIFEVQIGEAQFSDDLFRKYQNWQCCDSSRKGRPTLILPTFLLQKRGGRVVNLPTMITPKRTPHLDPPHFFTAKAGR